jgi:hypothetical protein
MLPHHLALDYKACQLLEFDFSMPLLETQPCLSAAGMQFSNSFLLVSSANTVSLDSKGYDCVLCPFIFV